MKKLILALTAILAVALVSANPHYSVVARKKAAGGGETLQQTNGSKGVTEDTFGSASDNVWESAAFTASSSFTLTKVVVSLKDANTPTGTITCYIYDDGTNEPGSSLATATGTLALPITGSFAEYEFTFSGLALTSSTNYFLVLQRSTTAGGWIILDMDSSGGDFDKSSDGTTWVYRSAKNLWFELWGN